MKINLNPFASTRGTSGTTSSSSKSTTTTKAKTTSSTTTAFTKVAAEKMLTKPTQKELNSLWKKIQSSWSWPATILTLGLGSRIDFALASNSAIKAAANFKKATAELVKAANARPQTAAERAIGDIKQASFKGENIDLAVQGDDERVRRKENFVKAQKAFYQAFKARVATLGDKGQTRYVKGAIEYFNTVAKKNNVIKTKRETSVLEFTVKAEKGTYKGVASASLQDLLANKSKFLKSEFASIKKLFKKGNDEVAYKIQDAVILKHQKEAKKLADKLAVPAKATDKVFKAKLNALKAEKKQARKDIKNLKKPVKKQKENVAKLEKKFKKAETELNAKKGFGIKKDKAIAKDKKIVAAVDKYNTAFEALKTAKKALKADVKKQERANKIVTKFENVQKKELQKLNDARAKEAKVCEFFAKKVNELDAFDRVNFAAYVSKK